MSARKSKRIHKPVQPQHMPVIDPHAAAIDVGSAEHWVAVPQDADPRPVRSFGAYTADLIALADWLKACGITSVALESTGVYWVPLFELLETRGFNVRVIDPRQASRLKGRPKSDVQDCQWLQRLHACGLLAAAFRPEDQIIVLRGYLRQRQMLLTFASHHIQHMQKALELMNLKLTEVVSDITGKTGLAIIKAILDGERDPACLARLRDPRCHNDEATIAKALQGNWRPEHLFALRQALELYEFYHRQIDACDRQIEAYLATLPQRGDGVAPPTPTRRGKTRHANAPSFDPRAALARACGVDLTAIEGIDSRTAMILFSEIGSDMSPWSTEKHFCSWLGLCPHHRITGGKVLSSRVRPGANRAAQALRLAARSLHASKSALGAFFRRLKSRLGAAQAIVATAHKLARLVYSLLKHGTAYVQQGLDAYEQTYRQRSAASLARKARELGYELVPAPVVS
jgi:transposase